MELTHVSIISSRHPKHPSIWVLSSFTLAHVHVKPFTTYIPNRKCIIQPPTHELECNIGTPSNTVIKRHFSKEDAQDVRPITLTHAMTQLASTSKPKRLIDSWDVPSFEIRDYNFIRKYGIYKINWVKSGKIVCSCRSHFLFRHSLVSLQARIQWPPWLSHFVFVQLFLYTKLVMLPIEKTVWFMQLEMQPKLMINWNLT